MVSVAIGVAVVAAIISTGIFWMGVERENTARDVARERPPGRRPAQEERAVAGPGTSGSIYFHFFVNPRGVPRAGIFLFGNFCWPLMPIAP